MKQVDAARKVGIIFGTDVTILATVSGKEIVYSDETTSLKYPAPDDLKLKDGIYDAKITKQPGMEQLESGGTAIEYVLRSQLVTPAQKAVSKKVESRPAATQSCGVGPAKFEKR